MFCKDNSRKNWIGFKTEGEIVLLRFSFLKFICFNIGTRAL